MIKAVTLPKWGLEMSEGTIAAWHAAAGARVEKGAPLVDVETEKIVNTLEADQEGIVRRRLANEGDLLPVGALIAIMAAAETSDAEIDAFIAAFKPVNASHEPEAAAPAPAGARSAANLAALNEAAFATPVARRLADENGIDLSTVAGTGRGGRIAQGDVEALIAAKGGAPASAPASAPESELIPWTAMRRSISSALVAAKQSVPHFYVSIDADFGAAEEQRKKLNAAGGQKITVNDVLIKAAALALKAVPDVSVHVLDEGIRRFAEPAIAVAVSIEGGLLTPVIRDAASKPLAGIAREAAELAARARARQLQAEDLKGATFSLSNLGGAGARAFAAIVNPPQGAILAAGALRREARETAGGVSFASVMTLTLSADHRAIDGALAAKFLSELKRVIESPDGGLWA